MANSLYDAARESFLKGLLAMQTQEVRALLIDTGAYTVNLATHDFLNDIPGGAIIATSAAMTSITTTAGVFDAADVVWTTVTGVQSEAIVLYLHAPTVGGTAYASSAAPLVAYIDTATGLPVTPNGQDITVTWDSGVNRIFKL